MWRRHGGLAGPCCGALTSCVGAFGTASLFSRSFQRPFAGVRIVRFHLGLLLQAEEVRVCVDPVVVHRCCSATISTTGHHHVSTDKLFPCLPLSLSVSRPPPSLSLSVTQTEHAALSPPHPPGCTSAPAPLSTSSGGVQMLNNTGIRVSSPRRAAAPSQG